MMTTRTMKMTKNTVRIANPKKMTMKKGTRKNLLPPMPSKA